MTVYDLEQQNGRKVKRTISGVKEWHIALPAVILTKNFLFFLFFFSGTRVEQRALGLLRQEFYLLSHMLPALLTLVIFELGYLVYAQAGL
jgi:hypothetical protein